MKAHISGTTSSNLELEVPHPEEIHTEILCFCLESVELQMRENSIFFTPVKSLIIW